MADTIGCGGSDTPDRAARRVRSRAVVGRSARGVAAAFRSPSRCGLIVAFASAIAQLAPVLGHGYVLIRDMTFVPRPPLTDHLLGVDAVPRSVPSDLLVALASHVIPGDAVQDLVLLALLTFAGWGAARVLPSTSAIAAAGTSLLYSWNPYVTEHLRQGQWAVLVGYAALPWVLRAAIDLRAGSSRAMSRLIVAVAVAAAGGASAELLAGILLIPLLLWPGGHSGVPRRTAVGIGALVITALPWAIPSLTQPSALPSDRVGVSLFAAQPESALRTAPSLLGLGGFWNAEVVPPGRGTVIVVAVSALVSVAALVALAATRGRWSTNAMPALGTAAAISFGLSVWGATPGARIALRGLVGHVSAFGLLRDGQRQLAPFALVVALGFGLLVEVAATRLSIARLLVVVPVLLLPAAAWGSDGAISAAGWPRDWSTARADMRQLPPGPVLVLPWASVRAYSWNGRTPQADATELWLTRRVVADDSLDVGGVSTPLEDPVARRIAPAATGHVSLPVALHAQGYAGVLLERDQPGAARVSQALSGFPLVENTPTLMLYRVDDAVATSTQHAPVTPTVAGDILAALAVALATASSRKLKTERRSEMYGHD